jgi:hypothetical protein
VKSSGRTVPASPSRWLACTDPDAGGLTGRGVVLLGAVGDHGGVVVAGTGGEFADAQQGDRRKATAGRDRRQGTVVQVRRTKWHLTKQRSCRPRNRSRIEPQLIHRHQPTTTARRQRSGDRREHGVAIGDDIERQPPCRRTNGTVGPVVTGVSIGAPISRSRATLGTRSCPPTRITPKPSPPPVARSRLSELVGGRAADTQHDGRLGDSEQFR